MVWIFVSPQTPYVGILTLKLVVLGGRAWRRYSGHDGINVLIKETPQKSLIPSPGEGTGTLSFELGGGSLPEGNNAGILDTGCLLLGHPYFVHMALCCPSLTSTWDYQTPLGSLEPWPLSPHTGDLPKPQLNFSVVPFGSAGDLRGGPCTDTQLRGVSGPCAGGRKDLTIGAIFW